MAELIDVAEPRDRHFVQSLARGIAVVTAFDGQSALTLEEVADRTGFSRSATRRLLRTLMSREYVSFDGHRFALTSRLLQLGYTQQSRLTLPEVARPHCERLASSLGRSVALGLLDGPDVVFVLRCATRGVVSVALGVGSRLPAHLTAIGRVLLAALPKDELNEFLDSVELTSETARSVTSTEKLREQLEQVAATGWAVVEQELEEGLSAVAAPIRDRGGNVVAAVNVSTQASGEALQRVDVPAALEGLLRTARQIEVDLHPTHLS